MATQPVHIDINPEIQDWNTARYGRQVRKASSNAFTKLQNQMNGSVDYLVEKGEAVDQATTAANDAATNANTKAGLANTAATNANTAAGAANTAKASADKAATAANTAAGNADTKAGLADAAAINANTKATLADTAAAAANTAKTNADKAAAAAMDIKDEIEDKLANGDFIGPQGNAGALVTMDPGLFIIGVQDGHLIVSYNDYDPVPPLRIRGGHLEYVVS